MCKRVSSGVLLPRELVQSVDWPSEESEERNNEYRFVGEHVPRSFRAQSSVDHSSY